MDDRSRFRNVWFLDASHPDTILGGLVQNGSITEKNALEMLDIILVSTAPIRVISRSTERVVSAVDSTLEPGDYLVTCESEIHLSVEPWVHRIISHSVSGREDQFRDGIRARDSKCVISGILNLNAPYDWTSWEAAHIFPLEKEDLWIRYDYCRWITNMDDSVDMSKVNSVQNGFLLQSNIHKLFDQYLISVNPDDNYKIISFRRDAHGIDGRVLDPVCCNPDDPHRVSDQLLRWHFRQSVLANMRGAGEPVFEDDFPPGTDIMKDLRNGPMAKERFELELSSRLKKSAK
ncbi:hypothetical protein VUR80DRAFT_1 [Thermomyces stellatus]